MPFQKRSKRKNVQNWLNSRKQKIAIKKQLIEISIRIDGYIYRNKPITVEEAEKYLVEISIHRTQCNNDVHILQVIEKLTRCLKMIIQETKNTLPPYQDVLLATSVYDKSVDLLHSYTNKHEDSNIVLDDGNIRESIEALSETKDQNSNRELVVVISDSEDEEKDDESNAQLNYMHNNSNKETVSSNHLSTQYAQSNDMNNENKKQLNQGKSKCDKSSENKKEILKSNGHLIVTKVKKPRQYKRKNNKTVEDAQQTNMLPIHELGTKNTKQKKKSNITHNPVPCRKALKDTTANTTHKELKMASKKTKNQAPKKKTNLRNTTTIRKKSTKSNNEINNLITSNFKEQITLPSLIAPLTCTQINHKHVDISGEVSHPAPTSYDAVSHTISNHESSALAIYNESIVNDLSWVENIRYVREINADEFDLIPGKIDETFWTDFSLPYEWKDTDFL